MRAVSFVAVLALAVAVQAVNIHHLHQQVMSAQGAVAAEGGAMSQGGDSVKGPIQIPPYVAPKADDCRSPCPALNTLANHGLLPHDGKGINYAMLKNALIGVYNLGPAFGFVFARAATKKFADPATGTFSLCDLLTNVHSKDQPSGQTGIEHSASMSREDRPTMDFGKKFDGTQRTPSAAQVALTLQKTSGGMFALSDFMEARKRLWAKSYAKLPALQKDAANTQEHIIANVEGCLLLGALSGNSNGGKFQISTQYAQSFLQAEKFPSGWQKNEKWELGIPQVLECLTLQGYDWAKYEWSGVVELAKHWFGID